MVIAIAIVVAVVVVVIVVWSLVATISPGPGLALDLWVQDLWAFHCCIVATDASCFRSVGPHHMFDLSVIDCDHNCNRQLHPVCLFESQHWIREPTV